MTRAEIKAQIREWDTETWKMEMIGKPTMKWYVEAKLKIKYDNCYTNSTASKFLAKARTNSLKIREVLGRIKENKRNNFDTTCQLCGTEEEDLEHFLLKCKKLEEKRDKEIIEKVRKIKEANRMKYILFDIRKWEGVSKMIYKLWHLRKILLKPP